ncbi:MAG: prolyl aminopeptidase [Paracoccus sp. (in: a-proteobacteria)]|nr:prolyl aminopeptidase [Paracoccus sp. (in: a-proteobacteria)]
MMRSAGHYDEAAGQLYPAREPFARQMLDVGDGHTLYLEQSGNPDGVPVIVLHGGPGGGSSPYMRRFFDPEHYRIVLFDQRGCGRSAPYATLERNTTAHLIEDLRRIRATLGITRAVLFGGSWGATLALAAAQADPGAVLGLVLRGVFLGRREELDWFYGGGAARFWPDAWAAFIAPIPEDERSDLIGAYHRRLTCGDHIAEARIAQSWAAWENRLATLDGPGAGQIAPDYARCFARLESHYFANGCFLDEGQILRDMPRISHLPGVIVQGRYDMVCPPSAAHDLAAAWPRASLRLLPASGHAMSEPRIARELARAMDEARSTWAQAGSPD